MKVVFLDVDGVLNAMPRTWREGYRPPLQPEFIDLLKQLLARSGAKVCVSSTWRIGDGYRKLVDLLVERGMTRDVFVGCTPRYPYLNRGAEIAVWLLHCVTVQPVDGIVILDDDADMGTALSPYLVQTRCDEGLTPAHVDAAVAVLERRFEDGPTHYSPRVPGRRAETSRRPVPARPRPGRSAQADRHRADDRQRAR